MTNKITKFMNCFICYWNGKEVGFISFIPMLNSKEKRYRVTRIVVLPDFQGLGISKIILETFGAMYKAKDIVLTIRTIHQGLGLYFENSNNWEALSTNKKEVYKKNTLTNNTGNIKKHNIENLGREAFSYKYVGKADNNNEIINISKDVYKDISFFQMQLF
jgi:GNAT superfamily N-acetyltransferase